MGHSLSIHLHREENTGYRLRLHSLDYLWHFPGKRYFRPRFRFHWQLLLIHRRPDLVAALRTMAHYFLPPLPPQFSLFSLLQL